MIIVDLVKQEIRSALGLHRPEQGGALYGPSAFPLISHFEYDGEARTTAASYIPSDRLVANVPRVEQETGLQLKGIIHSHPHGFTRPSGPDERAMQKFFIRNPHMGSLLLPIAQQLAAADDSGEFIHWYRVERLRAVAGRGKRGRPSAPPVGVVDIDCVDLPLGEHVGRLLDALAGEGYRLECNRRVRNLQLGGGQLVGLVATDDAGHELMYFVPCGYPVVAPVVLCSRLDGETISLDVSWNGLQAVPASLADVVAGLLQAWRPAAVVAIANRSTLSTLEVRDEYRPEQAA